jgi:hypothetical protein
MAAFANRAPRPHVVEILSHLSALDLETGFPCAPGTLSGR